ncbi:MAG: flavin reductase family protein, partial [Dehalococcoidia bacterium]
VQTVEVGGGASTLVLGEAVLAHIRDDLYKDGEIDVRKLKPVGKMEGFMFCRIQDVFEMKPPEVG